MVWGSARRRRRAVWAAGALALAGAVVGGLALVPRESGKRPPDHLRAGAVLPAKQVPLGAADRRAIDRTLDRFVVDAVEKRAPEAVRSLLKPGIDPRGVYPFPARGTQFHYWTLNESTRNHVSLDLMLQPTAKAAATTGPIVFTIRLDRVGGRWLVDSLIPTAIFNPTTHKVTAAVDYSPGLGRDPPKADPLTKAPLGATWVAVPLALVALAVAFPLAFLLVRWARGRRAWRRYRAEAERSRLPWETQA